MGTRVARMTELDARRFGLRLVDARTMHGLSQVEMAERLGVSQQTISGWENGRYAMGLEQLRAWCRICEVSADELLGLVQGDLGQRVARARAQRLIEDADSDTLAELRLLVAEISAGGDPEAAGDDESAARLQKGRSHETAGHGTVSMIGGGPSPGPLAGLEGALAA